MSVDFHLLALASLNSVDIIFLLQFCGKCHFVQVSLTTFYQHLFEIHIIFPISNVTEGQMKPLKP